MSGEEGSCSQARTPHGTRDHLLRVRIYRFLPWQRQERRACRPSGANSLITSSIKFGSMRRLGLHACKESSTCALFLGSMESKDGRGQQQHRPCSSSSRRSCRPATTPLGRRLKVSTRHSRVDGRGQQQHCPVVVVEAILLLLRRGGHQPEDSTGRSCVGKCGQQLHLCSSSSRRGRASTTTLCGRQSERITERSRVNGQQHHPRPVL